MPTLDESRTAPRMRFGSFELDLQSGELRRDGVRLRLQAQPFRMLSMLVERAGEVVSGRSCGVTCGAATLRLTSTMA